MDSRSRGVYMEDSEYPSLTFFAFQFFVKAFQPLWRNCDIASHPLFFPLFIYFFHHYLSHYIPVYLQAPCIHHTVVPVHYFLFSSYFIFSITIYHFYAPFHILLFSPTHNHHSDAYFLESSLSFFFFALFLHPH